jgi:hypothetical protein
MDASHLHWVSPHGRTRRPTRLLPPPRALPESEYAQAQAQAQAQILKGLETYETMIHAASHSSLAAYPVFICPSRSEFERDGKVEEEKKGEGTGTVDNARAHARDSS